MRLQHDGDGDHRIGQRRAEDRHQHQRQQQRREGQDDVHQPHDDRIEPFRREACDQADQDAARARRSRPRRCRHRRNSARRAAGATACPGPRRRCQADRSSCRPPARPAVATDAARNCCGRVVGRDHIGQKSDQDEGHEDPQAEDRAPVLAEIDPELGQPTGPFDGVRRRCRAAGHQRFRILGLMKP